MDKISFQSTVLIDYFQKVFCLIGKSLLDLQRESGTGLLLREGINTMKKEKSKLRRSVTGGRQFCDSSCQRHWLILKLNQSAKGSLSMQRFTRELSTRTHPGKCCRRTAEPEFWSAKKDEGIMKHEVFKPLSLGLFLWSTSKNSMKVPNIFLVPITIV